MHTSRDSVTPRTRGTDQRRDKQQRVSATRPTVRIHLVRPGRVVSLTSRFQT